MVRLADIYKIKESTFNRINELKSHGDPARGNKGKDREEEFYLVHGLEDPETGSRPSKVVYKRSFKNMVKDIEAEAIDMQKLANEHDEDILLQELADELKEIYNKFRTHARKYYGKK